MTRYIWLFSALFFSAAFANSFQKRLAQAEKGDFLVTWQGHTKTLLRVQENHFPYLILEEINFPDTLQIEDWGKWLQKRAPGHLSWTLYEMDLSSQQILECFSVSRGSWVLVGEEENFLKYLLALPLKPLTKEERRKIGPSPNPGEVDRRAVWNPPLIIHGKKQASPSWTVYQTTWPKDNSPLSEKEIELYFPENPNFVFPLWIQIKSDLMSPWIRLVDAGKHLQTACFPLPRRAPILQKKKGSSFHYRVKAPKYCLDFDLVLQEENTSQVLHPLIDFTLTPSSQESDLFELRLLKTDLPTYFSLQWIPRRHPQLAVEIWEEGK